MLDRTKEGRGPRGSPCVQGPDQTRRSSDEKDLGPTSSNAPLTPSVEFPFAEVPPEVALTPPPEAPSEVAPTPPKAPPAELPGNAAAWSSAV